MSRADRGRAHALRSASGTQLLVLGIVLAVFALWVVPGLSRSSHGAASGEAEESGEIADAVSSAPPDPTADAYRAVRAGDCLAAPDGPLPQPVDCAGDTAFLRVDELTAQPDDCPAGPGLSNWYHTSADGTTTALCLRREFRAGQCFAATHSTEHGRDEMTNADLRGPQDCAAQPPPPYNVTLVISEVLAVTGQDDGRECSRDPGRLNGYWYWIANHATAKVCATFPDPPALLD
jgi:hypothetical protein